MPSTTESAESGNDSVVCTSTNAVPALDNLTNTATTNSINQSITNLNLNNLDNNLTNGLLTTNNLSDESISYLNDKLNNNQNNTLINSNNLTNNLLATPTEQPAHYQYLKEFRVDQCQLFVQHKCTQHKPFTCFHWHFQNQRRRRPIRKKDGTFNYSPDNYCTKYDETTGVCPNGDDCNLLHRTAGDTERRYHLRYYKTGICVYDTDSRGFCAKNGCHCAFGHGQNDLRNPLYDIHEMTMHNSSLDDLDNNGYSTSVDKDRNALNEDPRWQDPSFVLSNYKTELCKKPPRLCRQGYACPQYHNSKDKRRSPKIYGSIRCTPCPSVKNGDEWGDPQNCESGDQCTYCHTRTEQQFHPEIYKSTKCNDIQQTNFCPRAIFCAFAHNDQELNAERELSMETTTAELANILSMTNAFANNQQQSNSVLEKSTLNASTNSNNSTNGLSSIVLNRNQFNNNQQFQSSNSISIAGTGQQSNGNFMPSSVPTHFSFADQLASLSGLRSQPNSGLSAFNARRENSPPMLNNNSLGPIARPRSYSSSHTTNLHHSNLNRESFLNSFFKNQSIEEKAAVVNGLVQQQQQNILPLRKVSTPSTLFAAATGSKTDSPTGLFSNQSQFSAALQSNLVNTSGSSQNLGSGIPNSAANQFFHNLDSTNTTVESVVHSLALDDLTLDDLEESIEKELLNRANLVNSSLQEESRNLQQQSNNGNATSNLVRSSSNLVNTNSGTAPVNIPGANQRADITNVSSPLVVGYGGQSPLSAAASLNQNVSSSVGSSLYDFASHSGMSPTNQQQQQQQQQQLNLIQQQQQQQNQAYLMNEINRLRDELAFSKSKGIKYEEELQMAKQALEFWKQEAEKAKIEKDSFERRNN